MNCSDSNSSILCNPPNSFPSQFQEWHRPRHTRYLSITTQSKSHPTFNNSHSLGNLPWSPHQTRDRPLTKGSDREC